MAHPAYCNSADLPMSLGLNQSPRKLVSSQREFPKDVSM